MCRRSLPITPNSISTSPTPSTPSSCRRAQKKLLVDNISAFDEVWTVSRGAGENLRSLGYEGDWRVMPNGVDFARGRVPDALVQETCGGFDLPEGVPVFLFVGRMMWYKGLRITLDALKKLKDAGHAFRMVFVGSGGDHDEVVAYAESLGLSDCVFFTSPKGMTRNVIRAWYRARTCSFSVDVRHQRPRRA